MCNVNRVPLLVLTVLSLAGCAGESAENDARTADETAPNVVQPGAPGEPTRTLGAEELAELEPSVHTRADVEFVQGMIHHHAQALAMTALVPKRSSRRDLTLLARRMDAAQGAEIDQLQRWLRTREEPVPTLHRSHDTGALQPGMLTVAELRTLERARGKAFDRLFLRFMIRHHRGALRMVEELYAGNGGLEPEVDAFARHIDSDQQIEIARMEQMLAGTG